MGDILNAAMEWLGKQPDTLFVGQSVRCPGTSMYPSLEKVPFEKKVEFPVAENLQLGYCLGLALEGFCPIAIYPRFNFLLLAADQMVHHLDRLMLYSKYRPKVIIRTAVGKNVPLNPGFQHQDDFSYAMKQMLKVIKVVRVMHPMKDYQEAYWRKDSTILVDA